jgi:hypothetical protein
LVVSVWKKDTHLTRKAQLAGQLGASYQHWQPTKVALNTITPTLHYIAVVSDKTTRQNRTDI